MTNRTKPDAQIEPYLPRLSNEEQAILERLPTSYSIQVPFFTQEKMHWSGPACAQMYLAFLNRSVPS